MVSKAVETQASVVRFRPFSSALALRPHRLRYNCPSETIYISLVEESRVTSPGIFTDDRKRSVNIYLFSSPETKSYVLTFLTGIKVCALDLIPERGDDKMDKLTRDFHSKRPPEPLQNSQEQRESIVVDV